MKKILTALVMLLCFCAVAIAQVDDVTLVVSGEGATKDEATTMALRSAIEQAFGVFVSANTEILNDELVKDEIATVASGNVKKYTELGVSVLPNNLTSVSIQATVSVKQLTTYAQSHGSSCEFAGATFAQNIKLARLQLDNTQKAIANLTSLVLTFENDDLYDISISTRPPTSVKYNAFSMDYLRNSMISSDMVCSTYGTDVNTKIQEYRADSRRKKGEKFGEWISSHGSYPLEGLYHSDKIDANAFPNPNQSVTPQYSEAGTAYEIKCSCSYIPNSKYRMIVDQVLSTLEALSFDSKTKMSYIDMGLPCTRWGEKYLLGEKCLDDFYTALNKVLRSELRMANYAIIDNIGNNYGWPQPQDPKVVNELRILDPDDMIKNTKRECSIFIKEDKIGMLSEIKIVKDPALQEKLKENKISNDILNKLTTPCTIEKFELAKVGYVAGNWTAMRPRTAKDIFFVNSSGILSKTKIYIFPDTWLNSKYVVNKKQAEMIVQ